MKLCMIVLQLLLAIPALAETRLLIKLKNPEQALNLARYSGRQAKLDDKLPIWIVTVPDWAAALARFELAPLASFIETDRALPPVIVPNDSQFPAEWHLQQIQAPAAWDITPGSSGITVAVLDTGVDPYHPELTRTVPGWNIYDGNSNTADVYGHGTAVAGTVAAATDNGVGVASVCWYCLLMPVRISGPDGWAFQSTAAQGLIWAADHGARVANISYEFSDSPSVQEAAGYFQARGGVVTIAAGNGGAFLSAADNPNVLTVSATSYGDAMASWSNIGPIVDLAAPGVDIFSTLNGGSIGAVSGTSFAAPIVAGIAALVLSADPSLSGAAVQQILKASADDAGPAGKDPQYGAGRVNAWRAVQLAAGGYVPPPIDDRTPPTVQILSPGDQQTISGNVLIKAIASDDVRVARIEFYIDGVLEWISSDTVLADRWNTRKVRSGPHLLTAKAIDVSGNQAQASIMVVVR